MSTETPTEVTYPVDKQVKDLSLGDIIDEQFIVTSLPTPAPDDLRDRFVQDMKESGKDVPEELGAVVSFTVIAADLGVSGESVSLEGETLPITGNDEDKVAYAIADELIEIGAKAVMLARAIGLEAETVVTRREEDGGTVVVRAFISGGEEKAHVAIEGTGPDGQQDEPQDITEAVTARLAQAAALKALLGGLSSILGGGGEDPAESEFPGVGNPDDLLN